ncbi:MAG: flagellar export protein FliJ [Planctomycetota bacterium]
MAAHGFRFRFQNILDLKENRQRALEMELARLDRAILDQEAARRRWERLRHGTLEQRRKARQRGDLVEDVQCANYLRHLRVRIGAQRSAVATLRGEREQVRRQLEGVMKSRKVLENYRDRLKQEFLAVHEKAEERSLEEHSVRSFIEAEGKP